MLHAIARFASRRLDNDDIVAELLRDGMKRTPSAFGFCSARQRRLKRRAWPPPPAPRVLEHHEVWVETTNRPTPTAFTCSEASLNVGASRADHEDPPSSQSPVVADTGLLAARVASRPGGRRRSGAQHWVAVIATFIGLAAVVGERDEISRAAGRAQLTTRVVLPVPAVAPANDPVASPCPEGMAIVEHGAVRVCVDRFEASLVEIGDDGLEHGFSPYVSVDEHVVKAISTPNAVPQAYLSRDQAESACQEAGKRLCTADEWKTACSGPDASLYPYGNTEDDAACNTHGKAPLGELFPRYGSEIYDFRVMNDPSLNALDGTVAKTGAHPRCTNGFGLYDMVGNLHEWTTETTGAKGEFHGGYYLDTHLNGDGCKYVTSVHDRSYHDYSTGFRCCADPD